MARAAPRNPQYAGLCGPGRVTVKRAAAPTTFGHDGLVARVPGGHWGWCPSCSNWPSPTGSEACNLPQGHHHLFATSPPANWAIHAGRAGTFVDPRHSAAAS